MKSFACRAVVGLAFACQEVDCIVPSNWDIPLDVVVTERGVIVPVRPRPRSAQWCN